MKNLVLILILMIAISSCSQSDENKPIKNSIVGSWQLIERTANNANGTPNEWEQIEDGYIITFNQDSTYESEISPSECNEIDNSSYFVQNQSEENILEINITCINPNMVFESKYSYSFESANHLVMIPIEPACDEGCSFKYRKVE
ncbi:hypothetical protein [Mariniflexile sp.]|uniref:hypothetical protein n=1 Tax=Mariniflexile sp. TaxID=1979402 RepID=UPI00404757FC